MTGLSELTPDALLKYSSETDGKKRESQVAEVTHPDRKFYQKRDKKIYFYSCIDWALKSDENTPESRRLDGQKKVIELYDLEDEYENALSYIQNLCGKDAFEDKINQRDVEELKGRWQKHFEDLICNIERSERLK